MMGEESKFSPDNLHQLDKWVKDGKDLAISHSKLCFKLRDGDVISPYQSLVCKYYYALVPFMKEVTLSDSDYMKYKNNPKKLSQDLYGTPELWSSLLYINNTVSIADFKKKKIKIFTSDILTKLEELLVLSEEDIIKNNLEISK